MIDDALSQLVRPPEDVGGSLRGAELAPSSPIGAVRAVQPLFAVTLLLSAFLLFCIEPMVAKMLLPLLGGVPAVWSTCLVFFQGALLLGYVFSLATLAWLGARRQSVLQVVLVASSLFAMPILIDAQLEQRFTVFSPPLRALAILCVAAALPFFAISTIAPTVQRWYSTTNARGAKDPYFLYAASNLGSLAGLLAYPLLLEPYLGLKQQARLLAFGYAGLAALVCICALATARFTVVAVAPAPAVPDAVRVSASRSRERWRWLFLSAVPSAYLVAVTSHLTTDVTPAPFLWVLPLAAYLLSFVIVFARTPTLSHERVVRYFPIAASFVVYLIVSGQGQPLSLVAIPVHVLTFFAAGLLCHGELARSRPSVERLNEFYVIVAAGGFVGGLAVGLVAPLVLNHQIEYPFCLALTLFARALFPGPSARRSDLLLPILVLASTVLSLALLARLLPQDAALGLFPLVPLFIAFNARSRARTFALCTAALLLGAALRPGSELSETMLRRRNFFGLVQVRREMKQQVMRVLHGTTLHGAQSLLPRLRREPMTYYGKLGPVGDVFAAAESLPGLTERVAVIGLGAGTLATYARSDSAWTFFEINPAVLEIARNSSLFSYLSDAFPNGENLRLVLGDARLELRADPGNYGVLMVDAFSADSIPVHLVTREALALYLQKTTPRAIIAWHISNRYIKMAPVLGQLAASEGLGALRRLDYPTEVEQKVQGARIASEWVVMSRDPATLSRFPKTWQRIPATPTVPVWTDDRSSVLALLSFHG